MLTGKFIAHKFTLKEERRLKIFENKILRRIFGPEKDENVEWGRLHIEELNNFRISPYIVKLGRARTRLEEVRSAFKIVTSIPTRKRTLNA